jgi:hypothetical protein
MANRLIKCTPIPYKPQEKNTGSRCNRIDFSAKERQSAESKESNTAERQDKVYTGEHESHHDSIISNVKRLAVGACSVQGYPPPA